jgi:NitT/TauT family transport system substrate-binding protein
MMPERIEESNMTQTIQARTSWTTRLALSAAAAIMAVQPAFADDQVKLTIGQRGNWDTAISHLGDKAGIFKKHGLTLDMIYTAGSGETLQPVIAGSVDVGLAVGTLGAMAAYSKGAPVRIIGAEATGAADYWYVKASSPIKTLKDLNGRSIAYSTAGSSTESVVRAFIKENGLTSAKAVSTGGAPSTMTAVMTDQVDAGWASPPGGLKEIDEGKIRLLARATDAAIVRGQTIRTIVANADVLARRKDVVARYMQAYRETIDYMYGDNPQVLKDYADFAGVSEAMAKRVRDEFFPRTLVMPDEIKGLDSLMADAVELKFISAPLSKQQIADLVQLQAPK